MCPATRLIVSSLSITILFLVVTPSLQVALVELICRMETWTYWLEGIREKMLTLPNSTKVFPGHGPDTTIELEKATNPFL